MKHKIESLLQQALQSLAISTSNIHIESPKDPTHGDWSTNIALILAKDVKMSPKTFAEKLISHIPADEDIQSIQIAGPGFINFTLSDKNLQKQIEAIWQDPTLGITPVKPQQTVVIDYSAPNLAKEMHVGHLRSTIIGDALARILEFKGYKVRRQNHVGDWGTQFGMLIAHLEDETKKHHLKLNDLEVFYKAAKKRFDSEPGFDEKARHYVVLLQSGDKHCLKLWNRFIKLSMDHCQTIYDRLDVTLKPQDIMAESAYNPQLPGVIEALRKKGLLIEHEGAQCVFMEEFKGKDKEILPVIVQKKDGGYLYATTDLAAIIYRTQKLHADRILYVVDARQALHLQQIFTLSRKADFVPENVQLEHIHFGMVLDKSGKPYKSRAGDAIKLSDLLDEAEKRAADLIVSKSIRTEHKPPLPLAGEGPAKVLGIAAVKYADLSKNRISDYVFDWDSMLSFEGNTAPYLLYAYTRVQSLFQKAGLDQDKVSAAFLFEHPQEKALVKHIIAFPQIIDTVVVKSTPHILCTWLYELAGLFSTFYEACPILTQENAALKNSRLKLAALTARILKKGLELLGISTLSRM